MLHNKPTMNKQIIAMNKQIIQNQHKTVRQLNNVGSYCERVEYSLTYLGFATFNVPYV